MIGVRQVNFSLSINWLLSIGAIAIGLIVAFIIREDLRPILLFVAPVLGGSAALIAAFNALESREAQVVQSKRTVALDCLLCWLNPSFYHAKVAGREILSQFKEMQNVEQQIAYLRAEPGREANLLDVLNYFEVLAVAIRMHLADEEVCKRFFETMVTRYWHTAEGCVRKRRTERDNPRLFQDMEWLAQRWSS